MQINITRRLAPEDIAVRMFVVVLGEVHEVYPPPWALQFGQDLTPMRVACIACADGEPRQVIAICLPFVQVVDAKGERSVLDVRRHWIARVSEDYGLEAFTRPRGPAPGTAPAGEPGDEPDADAESDAE